MDDVICPNCGKPVAISQAIRHELEEKVRIEQQEKHKLELEKAVKEAQLVAEKSVKEKAQKELEDVRNINKKLEDNLVVLKKQQEIDARKRKEEEEKIREQVSKEATAASRLEKLELEKKLTDTQKALEDAQRKAKQGSGQLRGDILEQDLELTLREAFPNDAFRPVPTGIRGGDIVHEIRNKYGNVAGVILWEAKRQKAWSKVWLVKLREDMRKINASDCILVTDILPPNVKIYERIDNVWITSYEYVVKLTTVLRLGLMNVAIAKSSATHTDEQLKELYRVITSDSFRQKFEARKEIIDSMRQELESEKANTERRWKRQATTIDNLARNNREIYGELEAHIPSLKPLGEGEALELESGEDEESNIPLL